MSEPFKWGGKKHQNYCAKRVRGSKYCNISFDNESFVAAEAPGAVSNSGLTNEGLVVDDGSTVQLSTIKTLSRGSRELLQHIVYKFNGPVATNQTKLAQELGYKTTEPVRKILNELQDKSIIREFKSGIYNGTRIDLRVDAKSLAKLLQENESELNLSKSGEKLLDYFRSKNQKELPVNYRSLGVEVGISSPNALKAGLEELEASGLIKKNSSKKGTTISLEGSHELE